MAELAPQGSEEGSFRAGTLTSEEGAHCGCCWYLRSLEKSFLDLELIPLRKSAARCASSYGESKRLL